MIAATLTSVIVFLPIIFGEKNEMNIILRELGITVCATLLASLFVSQTLIPLAMSKFIRSRPSGGPGRVMGWLQRRHESLMAYTLRHVWLAPLVGLAVVGSGAYPFLKIEKHFDVTPTEMFVGIRYQITEALSLDLKEQLVNRVEAALQPHKDRLNVNSIYSFWSDDWAMTRVYMKEGHTHETAMNEVRKELRDLLPRIPGVTLEVQDNVPFWQRNRGKRVGFRLSGEDTEVLTEIAKEAKRKLEEVEGLFGFYNTAEGGKFEVETRVDRDLAREYGVNVDQAAEVVELTFRGRRLPRFLDGDREVEMNLTLDEQDNETIEQLKSLPLLQASSSGGRRSGAQAQIPLATVADFAVVQGPEQVSRDNRVTGVWIGARYEEGVQEEYVEQCKALLDDIELPYGYRWDHDIFQGDEEAAQTEFITNILLALGLIFAVMAGLFESVRQAISLMVSLPFALAGAAWALFLTGVDFDRPAAVGLLLLLGIVVNNGIVMIEHINKYRREGMERRAAMLRGGHERLRPVLMAAITTLLGLLPIVIQKPALAGVYYYSMAIVIMGGLLISTVLTTVLLPATVVLTEDTLGWMGRVGRFGWLGRAGRVFRWRKSAAVVVLLAASQAFAAPAAGAEPRANRERVVGLPCEGCEWVFDGMPVLAEISHHARIAPVGEPGEAMRIEGTVYAPVGAPAAGIVVYAYHTDTRGIYPAAERLPDGTVLRHGRLRSWAKTDENGRYRFDTIRPAGYPSTNIPQHVHMHVIEPGRCTYYIDDIHFDDDPRFTPAQRRALVSERGGSGVATPERDADGTWLVTRDIHLGRGVPGYPVEEVAPGTR